MKILIISPKNKTIFNFRGDLIKDMVKSGNEVYVTGPNQDYIDDIYALGVSKFFEVPLIKDNTSVSGDYKYLKNLEKVIKELKPDLVFSYTIKPVVYGSIAAHKCGVKNIYAMVTGLGRIYASKSAKAKLVRMVTKVLYKKAFRYCKKVIFQNNDDIEELVGNNYLPRSKCEVVNGSGVNMERFARTDMPKQPTFLMVSRIIKEKGVLDFAEAARMVKKDFPNARFILLGGYDKSIGALKEEDLRQYVQDGSIEIPGEVKDPVEYYAGCSVFVLPSYYREGLPRTILEAMSCARPVITTDWVGCKEPMEDGINGFLVPIKSPNELAQKMLLLCKDNELLNTMSENAYEICRKRFDVNVVNKQMKLILGY